MNPWRLVNRTTGNILACVVTLGVLCSGGVLLAFATGPLACDQHEAAVRKRQREFFDQPERMIDEARREVGLGPMAQDGFPR